MNATLTCALPADYLLPQVLAFHARDAEQVSEQVGTSRIRKALLLDSQKVLLDVHIGPRQARCQLILDPDVAAGPALRQQARDALLNLLGLRLDPAPFIAQVADDALFGHLVRQLPPQRIVQSCTPFEAITWAIIGQQINLSFAISLRRSLTRLAGQPHAAGLTCLPDAGAVARLDVEQFMQHKFSRAKAETVLRVARSIADGSLVLDRSRDMAEMSRELLAIKGIGPWTANYLLLRGFGYPDCSLHGDVAVRAALQKQLGSVTRPGIDETEQILARYAPQRTMAAAYLWASLRMPASVTPPA